MVIGEGLIYGIYLPNTTQSDFDDINAVLIDEEIIVRITNKNLSDQYGMELVVDFSETENNPNNMWQFEIGETYKLQLINHNWPIK